MLEISDVSPENVSSSSKKYDDSSALSSVSPNLIRPFDELDDRWISPNLIEPFEGDVKNKTFIKVVLMLVSQVALAVIIKESSDLLFSLESYFSVLCKLCPFRF